MNDNCCDKGGRGVGGVAGCSGRELTKNCIEK